jgi:hypothetical protein
VVSKIPSPHCNAKQGQGISGTVQDIKWSFRRYTETERLPSGWHLHLLEYAVLSW